MNKIDNKFMKMIYIQIYAYILLTEFLYND